MGRNCSSGWDLTSIGSSKNKERRDALCNHIGHTLEFPGRTELYTIEGGIGADDKLGCAIALALVDALPVVKAAFFVEEELGMLGSRELDKGWFADVGFCLSNDSPDRNRASRTCSNRLLYPDRFFREILQPVCARHGVTRFNNEPFTDVTQIRDRRSPVPQGRFRLCRLQGRAQGKVDFYSAMDGSVKNRSM